MEPRDFCVEKFSQKTPSQNSFLLKWFPEGLVSLFRAQWPINEILAKNCQKVFLKTYFYYYHKSAVEAWISVKLQF